MLMPELPTAIIPPYTQLLTLKHYLKRGYIMQNLEMYGLNYSLANTVTTAAGAVATISLTNPTVAVIDGTFAAVLTAGAKTFAFVDANNVAKAATSLLVNQACVVVNCIDASGAMKNIQGKIVDLDAVTGQLVQVAPFPKIPDTLVPFSYLTVKAGSTSAGFIFGTSLVNATGITITPVNVSVLPARPVWP
jgi:hypothetical protein